MDSVVSMTKAIATLKSASSSASDSVLLCVDVAFLLTTATLSTLVA